MGTKLRLASWTGGDDAEINVLSSQHMKDRIVSLFASAGDRAEELAAPMLAAIDHDTELLKTLITESLPVEMQASMSNNIDAVLGAVSKGLVAYLYMAEAGKRSVQAAQGKGKKSKVRVRPVIQIVHASDDAEETPPCSTPS